jgi:hypothetical protein
MGLHSLPWTGAFTYHQFNVDVVRFGGIAETWSFYFNTQTLSLRAMKAAVDNGEYVHFESLDGAAFSATVFNGIDNCNGFPPAPADAKILGAELPQVPAFF